MSRNRIYTAFFLQAVYGYELDVHALRIDEWGRGIPAWKNPKGFIFAPLDLGGEGMVAGYAVRCQSAENQMICHMRYDLVDKQVPDVERLQAKLGVAFPENILRQFG